MVSPQSDDEQFNFYLKFAKPLVLNLSDTNDRIKAAAWIRKLKNEAENATLRTDYLKLLLFVLQRRKLIGPFSVIPDDTRPLQPFPEEINLQDVAKNFVEIDKKVLKEAIEKGGFGEWPPYNVACSSDLKEYAVSQDIPNFGIHVYFAISKDPIHYWEKKNKAIFPIGEKINSSNDFGLNTNISPNISSFVPQDQTTPTTEKVPRKVEGGDGFLRTPERKDTIPSSSDPFDVNANITPTWGSNLMKVNDDVLDEDLNEENFNFNISNKDMLDNEDLDLDELDGISDLEDSFYLEGDKLKSPICPPCYSPASSLTYKTSPAPSVSLPSPAPSLPFKTPPIPSVNLPSPAPSLPYKSPPMQSPESCLLFKTPSKSETPNDYLLDSSNIDNADMLDYMDQSVYLIDDEEKFFDDIAKYLQSDSLQSPPKVQPCDPCGTPSKSTVASPAQRTLQASPAPSLPYKTPPVPNVYLPSPPTTLPYRTPPRPRSPYNLKHGTPDKTDMLDYINESMELVEDISLGDAAQYLQMDRFTTPPKQQQYETCAFDGAAIQSPAPSLPYRTPPMPLTPRSQVRTQTYSQPCQPCESQQNGPTLDWSEEEELKRLEREIFDEIHDLDRVQTPEHIKRMKQQERQLETRDEGLGGDSFIAPESKDYQWLLDVSPGPGLPEGVEQDPNLWESFGWWTDDPNEIFEYIPPSPRVCGSPDPYAEERERWADVPATPPIFSRNPQIQAGPGAQRIYAIEEFGMESFEEPVWTPAEQYMKYMPETPYQDPRDINRQTLDMAQYNTSPELNKQIFDAYNEREADYFFTEEQPPIDDLQVSFNEKDFQKMTHAQATLAAMQHGPVLIGAPPSPPLPPLEDQIHPDEAMVDVEFLAKTPPKFVFEPVFFSTPPAYHPNTSLKAADFDESISKYVEDEMKIIQSNIPVTTPQRSPSPKRVKRFIGNESLPNIEDTILENENLVTSPEIKTPPRYQVPPKKEINWNIEIGEPRKISPLKPAYLGIPDDEKQAKSAKRMRELAAMYKEQFASPPVIKSPETPPHLIDEPIPCDLRSPLPPKKLPPPGWKWQSPPTAQKPCYVPPVIKTPTGLTPPKKMPEDVTMYYESPPYEIYSPPPSPSSAIGAVQFSPPSHFDSPPSPIRSPGGRPIFGDWQPVTTADDIEMEQVFPTQYTDFIVEEYPDLYTSPVRAHSPEILKELERQTENLSPISKKKFYDAEIEALENELFKSPSAPCGSGAHVQSPGSPVTPEYERRIWRENLKLHDLDEYWKRQWVVRPKPGKTKAIRRFTLGSRLGTISDQEEPPSPSTLQKQKTSKDAFKQYLPSENILTNIEAEIDTLRKIEEEELRKTRQREADRQVMQDMADLTKITLRTPSRKPLYVHSEVDERYVDQIKREIKEVEALCQRREIEESVRQQIQSQFTSPPRSYIEPEVHPFDEPLPEENELPPALLPPSGWDWKTPPKYKLSDYKPREKRTPTGLATPEKMSEDVTMFYESPPHEMLSPPVSPCAATLQYTPTCGFNLPSSPIRSPGGRPITDSWQIDNIIDEIDLDKVYPAQFEDIYEEEPPELYMSPPNVIDVDKTSQSLYKQPSVASKISNRPLSPVTPEQERQMWKEKLKLHELRDYWRKQWTVRPKPGKTRKVNRFTPRPALHTIPDEREQLSPETRPVQDETIEYTAEMNAQLAAMTRELEAAQDVLKDIMDLPEVLRLSPPERQRYIIHNDPTADIEYITQLIREADELEYMYAKRILKSKIKKRIQEQFASPPRISSPEPVIHPFDQPLLEEEKLPPALLPPSGWSWQTPPKFKLPDYKPKEKYSPRGISPEKLFSEDVTMFYESPPHELLLPTSPCNVRPSQDFSPPLQDFSPPLQDFSPPSQIENRQYNRIDDDKYLENILTSECVCIDEEDYPELYVSPPKDKSPEQIQAQQTPAMMLEERIAALEYECFGEKITTPTRKTRKEKLPDTDRVASIPKIQYSPETPEYKRQLWRNSLKLHEFDKEEQYPKQNWVVQPKPSKKVRVKRHVHKPKLKTICDVEEPSPQKIKQQDIIKAERQMQESRKIYEEAQKQAMQDILQLKELTQANMVKKSPCYQKYSEEQKAKLKEEIARRVREQFSSPPQVVHPESAITHPLDEELPPDLPSALLPPSGWTWKTPPRFQHQPFVAHKITSPSGVSPPQQIDPESLLYESPPQLPPEEDFEEICIPCSPTGTSTKSPREKLIQTPKKIQIQQPPRSPISPCALPPFVRIKSPVNIQSRLSDYHSIPYESDRAQISPIQFEDIDQEFPPEEFNRLPSPPPCNEPEKMSDDDYRMQINAEMRAVEDVIQKIMEKPIISPGTPPTPKYARKKWQQELASRSPLHLQERTWVVKPTPGKSYIVRKSKKPRLSPVKEKYLEWSPDVVFESPVTSPGFSSSDIEPTETTPSRQPQMPPENWTWKSPSPQTLKTMRQKLIKEGMSPCQMPTEELSPSSEIYNESPPYVPESPPDTSPIDVCSPCSGASPPQSTPEFYYSPETESPALSPDISPYRSPLRSPGGRPIIPEWAQDYNDDFYFSEILPHQHELVNEEVPPEEMYSTGLPPTPPPLPSPPRPYLHQIKLTPRTRPKPDKNLFSPERSPTGSPDVAYQSLMSPCRPCRSQPKRKGPTPESAKRPYESIIEAVRFEPKRPTPILSPRNEYETPTRAQFRGYRRRRQINREAPRRRLIFDEETDLEDGVDKIQNLQRNLESSIPPDTLYDVAIESPPKDVDISVLTDFDYEPAEFNIFQDENTEEYNIRLPFEGYPHYSQDTSPIPVTDEIPEEEKDFRWLSCSSKCQNSPKR